MNDHDLTFENISESPTSDLIVSGWTPTHWGEYFQCVLNNSINKGCTDIEACNYNQYTCSDDGSCTFPGCTNSLAINFNPFAGCDDGSCEFIGCNDYLAINYSPLVTIPNNNSCLYTSGCTYELATNYNAQAITDDGSCVIELTNNQCLGDLDGNGAVTALDLSMFLGVFGTSCTD